MENKKRLIDANALDALGELPYVYNPVYDGTPWYRADDVWNCIDGEPIVDAVEVVHGRWFDPEDDGGGTLWYCNQCHHPVKTFCLPPNYNYCPNCGAKMDGDNR